MARSFSSSPWTCVNAGFTRDFRDSRRTKGRALQEGGGGRDAGREGQREGGTEGGGDGVREKWREGEREGRRERRTFHQTPRQCRLRRPVICDAFSFSSHRLGRKHGLCVCVSSAGIHWSSPERPALRSFNCSVMMWEMGKGKK